MSSQTILDFERLLAPIPGDNPGGTNLREDFSADAVYQRVKDARSQARAIERQILMGGDDADGKRPDWAPVLDLAPPAIQERAKDLEIVAWLTEALIREHEFAGLRDGLRLARELVLRFWDHLYPLPDPDGGDGPAARVAPLAGLNVTLVQQINNIPLTQDAPGSAGGPYARSDFQRALAIEQTLDPDKRARQIDAAGGLTMQSFDAAARASEPGFLRARVIDLDACLGELAQLSAALDERCGEHSPSLGDVRDALEACRAILAEKAPAAVQPADDAASSTEVAATNGNGSAHHHDQQQQGGGVAVPTGGFRTREDAFQALLRVAEYFRQREPHSPVSYALEQVVRWGRKPLPELWSELIGEEQVRTSVFKLVGITAPPPPPENQGSN